MGQLSNYISRFNGQIRQLNRADDDAVTFNSKLDNLASAINDNLQTLPAEGVREAALALKDKLAPYGADSNINGAINNLQLEIKTIQAAIDAQKRAAEAIGGGGGGMGSW